MHRGPERTRQIILIIIIFITFQGAGAENQKSIASYNPDALQRLSVMLNISMGVEVYLHLNASKTLYRENNSLFRFPRRPVPFSILRGFFLFALRANVILQIFQFCLVADDSGADIENVLSSTWREFDGGSIAHAAGAGGFGLGGH